ncbi:TetR/AcrR family transcriptional regulator [Mucilaginibacter rigui]|uniref:TetR/AcrR family transcriptional regulator n=1 Tax=Mucilaginibacter rigui TaxID=534635 RepID=A0ABR7X3U8_9SPHI|nr:TetR/AcrR family transcriptional regulator [Mucilaginibacter rigui]MBD1384270.1 TetR/AcrR family transcriptional regulator [Mucilaginibacter rigui]
MPRKKDFDEDELLEKAVNIFWKKGYHATSAQDLVDGLGINRSSLYNTYTDKRTLFTKSLKMYQQQRTGLMLNTLQQSQDISETIKQIFNNIIDEDMADTMKKGCFMVNTAVELSGQDQEINDIVTANNQSVEDALVAAIEKGRQSGQVLNPLSSRAIAQFIFATISALRVTARSGAGRQVMQNIADVALYSLK